MQRAQLVETLKVLDHESFTSAVELHHLVPELVKNLTGEDVDVAHLSATGYESANDNQKVGCAKTNTSS